MSTKTLIDKTRKITVIGTGGTIACGTGIGKRPENGAAALIKAVSDLEEYTLDAYNLMNKDSCDMQPSDVVGIAEAVYSALQEADGVVITHGTDTLTETAALLTYLVQQPGKPVVITGAMNSMGETDSDAPRNLRDAVHLAMSDLAGTYVSFSGRVFNSTRIRKDSPKKDNAFETVNVPQVAKFRRGELHVLDEKVEWRDDYAAPTLYNQIEKNVAVYQVHQEFNPDILDFETQKGKKGIVLECPGSGGIPNDVVPALQRWIDSGRIAAITSRCTNPSVDLDQYEVGQRMQEMGNNVISCYDMTTDAAVAKLRWALGTAGEDASPSRIKEMMHAPIAYDIKVPMVVKNESWNM